MKEAYCSEEVSKLLEKKGFHEPCTGLNKLMCKDGEKPILRITHQKAMAWIRKKGYHIYSYYLRDWNFAIQKLDEDWEYHKSGYNSHEEAIEAALKDALENLI